MENATQALIIAGGILFAILTLSLFVYMFNNMAVMQNAKANQEKTEELASWNMQWESYNKQYLYGLDVLTVINKAEDNNAYYNDSKEYVVTIEVDGIEANHNSAIKNLLMVDKKTTIYTCLGVEYNEYGRVCKMFFQEDI